MLPTAPLDIATAIDELARAAESVRHAASSCSDGGAAGIVSTALRTADSLIATAVELVAARGGLERSTGLSTEIRVDTRRQVYRLGGARGSPR